MGGTKSYILTIRHAWDVGFLHHWLGHGVDKLLGICLKFDC